MGSSTSSSSESSGRTCSSLIVRAQAQDAAAWEELADLYGPLIYGWTRRQGLSAEDAADVLQDVLRRVAGGIEGFRGDGHSGSFRAWLWTITRNQIRDHIAAARRGPQAVGGTDQHVRLHDVPEELPDDETKLADDARLLHRLLESVRGDFSEQTWSVFRRSAVEAEDTAAIAADLGMTHRAIRQAKHRVMKRLREEFGDLID